MIRAHCIEHQGTRRWIDLNHVLAIDEPFWDHFDTVWMQVWLAFRDEPLRFGRMAVEDGQESIVSAMTRELFDPLMTAWKGLETSEDQSSSATGTAMASGHNSC